MQVCDRHKKTQDRFSGGRGGRTGNTDISPRAAAEPAAPTGKCTYRKKQSFTEKKSLSLVIATKISTAVSLSISAHTFLPSFSFF